MKILILGGTGMLGHKLYQTARMTDAWVTVRGEALSLSRYGFYCPDRVIGDVDVTDDGSIRKAMDTVRPNAVVNCVGVIKQHPSAKDPQICIQINALFPHRMAALCAEYSARFIHISTDCVFAGTKGRYKDGDLTDAEDLYGRSKALGETAAANALTLRTSIIGRELNSRFGLVEWFLANRNQEVKGYTRAHFSGFTTHELSRLIEAMVVEHPFLSGIHQVSSDPIDKCALLHLLRDAYRLETTISPCGEVWVDRTLDSTPFRALTGYQPPEWPKMVREMAADPTPYEAWR